MEKDIERIVREFIPHKDTQYIPDLVKALKKYCIVETNKSYSEGRIDEADALGKDIN